MSEVLASQLLRKEATETWFPESEDSGIKLETCIHMHQVGQPLFEKPHPWLASTRSFRHFQPLHLISHPSMQECTEFLGMRSLALKHTRESSWAAPAVTASLLGLGRERGHRSWVENVSWLSSSAFIRGGCGNGEASCRQDGGRLISSSRSEVSGNERQRWEMQIAAGFMEQFLLTKQIPHKWTVNKAGKLFGSASCWRGTFLTGIHTSPTAGVPTAQTALHIYPSPHTQG